MEFIKTLVANEPVLVRIVFALVALAAAYGLPIPEGAASLIAELVAAGLTIFLAWGARQKVTPVAKLASTEEEG